MKYLLFTLALIISLFIFDYLLMEMLIYFLSILKNYFWIVVIVIFLGLYRFADFFINIAALPVYIASLIIKTPISKKIAIVLFALNYIYILYGLFEANYSKGMNLLIVVIFGVITFSLIKRELKFLKVNSSDY